MTINFYEPPGTPALTLADYQTTASAARIEVAALRAVTVVESSGHGFMSDRRPWILDEAHIFGRLTGHRWDRTHPNISASHWDRSLYGAPGAHQYDRLAQAMNLDEDAALEACSWGLFQILGMNYRLAGYSSVKAYVDAMVKSEAEQLAAFIGFCGGANLLRFLRAKNWPAFALGYNGAGYRINHYDSKLASAYALFSRKAMAAPRVDWHGHAQRPDLIGEPW